MQLVLLALVSGCSAYDAGLLTGPDATQTFARKSGPSIVATELPSLGGPAEASSINDDGVAVGFALPATGPGYTFAVRWESSGGIWSITQLGGRGTKATAINASGAIVGDSVYHPYGDAVLWFPGSGKEVVGPGEANGINDAGVVVGIRASLAFYSPAAWRKVEGSWVASILENAPGTVYTCPGQVYQSQATAINNDDVIVGFLYAQDCSRHYAVKWVPKPDPTEGWEPAELLPNTAAMVRSYAYAIEGNTIVGEAWPCAALEGCARRAYRWSLTAGSPDTGPIGSLDARANGINAAGTAVGSYLDPQRMRAVMWNPSSSTHVTLPALSPSRRHWVLDINNPTPSRSARLAVGGAGVPVLWTIP